MTRKFKMAGVLMAVVAMFALTASAAQAQFTASKYPATVTATSTADVFDAFGSTVKCTNNSFTGTLPKAESTLTITPTYSNCTAFGLPATVQMTSCKFVFHTNAPAANTVGVNCSTGGDAIDITVYTASDHKNAICHVKVPAQENKTGYSLTNNGDGTVQLAGSVAGLTATQVRTNTVLCPPGTHREDATYTIQAGGIKVSNAEAGQTISVD